MTIVEEAAVVVTAAEAASGEAVIAAKLMRAADMAPNMVVEAPFSTEHNLSSSVVKEVAVAVHSSVVVDCGDGDNAILVLVVVVVR